jgi:hypothetical protein
MKSWAVILIVLFSRAPSVFGSFSIINAASSCVESGPSISKSNLPIRSLAPDLEDITQPNTRGAKKSSLDIVQDYTNAIERDTDFGAAAKFLATDFKFLSPTKSFQTREAWLRGFPKFHKNSGTTFQDPIPGAHDKQVIRKGKVRIAVLSVNLVAVYEMNNAGEIVTIRVGRA